MWVCWGCNILSHTHICTPWDDFYEHSYAVKIEYDEMQFLWPQESETSKVYLFSKLLNGVNLCFKTPVCSMRHQCLRVEPTFHLPKDTHKIFFTNMNMSQHALPCYDWPVFKLWCISKNVLRIQHNLHIPHSLVSLVWILFSMHYWGSCLFISE